MCLCCSFSIVLCPVINAKLFQCSVLARLLGDFMEWASLSSAAQFSLGPQSGLIWLLLKSVPKLLSVCLLVGPASTLLNCGCSVSCLSSLDTCFSDLIKSSWKKHLSFLSKHFNFPKYFWLPSFWLETLAFVSYAMLSRHSKTSRIAYLSGL